tara:strand:- start:162 stop:584 length:423 start_codon:yes stop_codon:yes gene_type:complete
MNPLSELLGMEDECSTRKCRRCEVFKPIHAFEINSYGSQKFHRKICKECRGTQINSKKVAIIKKWGTTKLIKPPEGTLCECCNVPMIYGQKSMNSMCFDHDPVKEKFRGWICKKCNTVIGFLGDDIDGTKKLVMYLEERQ